MFASKYSLTKKMIFLCLFSAIVTLGVGSTAFIFFNKVTHHFDEVVDLTVPKMQLTYDMLNSYQKVRISLRTLGIDGITSENTEKHLKEAQEAIAEFEKYRESYVELGFSEKQKELFVIMVSNWDNFKSIGSEISTLSQKKDS